MTAAASGPAADEDDALCPFCGEPEHVSLFEAWEGGAFQVQTCCEWMHETVAAEMDQDRAWALRFLRGLGAEALLGHRLRRVADDGCASLLLDFQLALRPVSLRDAKAFVARHHQHCGVPVTARFQQAVWNGPATMLGVALVGNPVARALCGRNTLEVSRLCIRRDLPAALRWNAASMLLGWCAAEAARQGWRRLVSYTLEQEPGTSLVAAGWRRAARVRGRGWHSARRPRGDRNAWADKVRWEKELRPARPTRVPAAPPSLPSLLPEATLFDRHGGL